MPSAKHLLLAAVALVFGLVIGGLGPRSEVRALQARVDELEAAPRRGGAQVTSLFRGRMWENEASGSPAPEPSADVVAPSPEPAAEPSDAEPPSQVPSSPPSGPGDAPPLDDHAAEQIKEGLQIRRAQAIAALREQAGATEDQMADVDEIVDQMNADLAAVAETWVAATGEGDLSRRDMMLLASETLDVLIDTEDALYGTFSSEQRASLSEEILDPTAYVDGSVVDRFAELEPR
jgi:hypothetical protein